jgi:hypothetical protein
MTAPAQHPASNSEARKRAADLAAPDWGSDLRDHKAAKFWRAKREAEVRAEKAEAERDRAKEACKTLGRIIEQQCDDILHITGLHDFIDEDGDGDWAAVWENAYSLPTVAEWERLQAERDAAREALARVEALADEWERNYASLLAGGFSGCSIGADSAAKRIRAALAQPATEEEAGA